LVGVRLNFLTADSHPRGPPCLPHTRVSCKPRGCRPRDSSRPLSTLYQTSFCGPIWLLPPPVEFLESENFPSGGKRFSTFFFVFAGLTPFFGFFSYRCTDTPHPRFYPSVPSPVPGFLNVPLQAPPPPMNRRSSSSQTAYPDSGFSPLNPPTHVCRPPPGLPFPKFSTVFPLSVIFRCCGPLPPFCEQGPRS